MTTAKYAIVLNSVVENIVLWDGDYETWTPPDGSTAHLLRHLPASLPLRRDYHVRMSLSSSSLRGEHRIRLNPAMMALAMRLMFSNIFDPRSIVLILKVEPY